jgi:hypothetical protein
MFLAAGGCGDGESGDDYTDDYTGDLVLRG